MNHTEKYNVLVKLAQVTSNIKARVNMPVVKRPAAPQAVNENPINTGDDSPIHTGDDSPIHGVTMGQIQKQQVPPMNPRPAVLPGKPVPTTSTSQATSPVTAVQSNPVNQPITDRASLDPVNRAPAATTPPPPTGNLLGLPQHQFDTVSQAYQRQGRGDFGALSAKRQKTMYDRFRNFYLRGN